MEIIIAMLLIAAVLTLVFWKSRDTVQRDTRDTRKRKEKAGGIEEFIGAQTAPGGRLISGLPGVFKEHDTLLVLKGNAVHVLDSAIKIKLGEIPLAAITGASIVDESYQILDTRPRRIYLWGIWALVYPKYITLDRSFLCISWQHNNTPCETVFEFASREEAEMAREGVGG